MKRTPPVLVLGALVLSGCNSMPEKPDFNPSHAFDGLSIAAHALMPRMIPSVRKHRLSAL